MSNDTRYPKNSYAQSRWGRRGEADDERFCAEWCMTDSGASAERSENEPCAPMSQTRLDGAPQFVVPWEVPCVGSLARFTPNSVSAASWPALLAIRPAGPSEGPLGAAAATRAQEGGSPR